MLKSLNILLELLVQSVPLWVQQIVLLKDEIIIYSSRKYIYFLIFILKNSSIFKMQLLIDLTAVDYYMRRLRFDVCYHLLSIKYNNRVCIKIKTDEGWSINSVTNIYSTAGWFEREIWDMFGITFFDNKDLRKILTDYGFHGFPLRKSFPITGYVEVRYSEFRKRIISEPLELSQEFRNFDFIKAWNVF